MATFKIKQLLVSLGPRWCGDTNGVATDGANLALNPGEVIDETALTGWGPCQMYSMPGPGETICAASNPHHPHGLVASPDQLGLLKASLQATMQMIDTRQELLHARALQGIAEPTTVKEAEALQRLLAEAIEYIEAKKASLK